MVQVFIQAYGVPLLGMDERVAMVRPFRRGLFNRVGLNVGAPVGAEGVTPEGLRERVASLLA